jgi:hypothetical protein
LLRNLRRYLAPESRLVVTVPAGPRNAYEIHIGHRRHYTRQMLRTLLEGEGFDVVEMRAAGFPFFNLYKLMALARGDRLVADADAPPTRQPLAMRASLAAFRALFRLNVERVPLGWQLVAVAVPRRQAASPAA